VLLNQPSCDGSSLALFNFRQQRLCVDRLSNCCDVFEGLLGASEELLHVRNRARVAWLAAFSETEVLPASWR